MQELMYLLKVPAESAVQEVLQDLLLTETPPAYVRLSTMAPLSNWGYPPEAQGALLAVTDSGVVVGCDDIPGVPRSFVPWQNVSYIAESGQLENS